MGDVSDSTRKIKVSIHWLNRVQINTLPVQKDKKTLYVLNPFASYLLFFRLPRSCCISLHPAFVPKAGEC